MYISKLWNKKQGIYKIECNNRLYIGSSINIYERLLQHRSHLRANKHHSVVLQRHYNKYGEDNLNISIIEITNLKEEGLRQKEKYYIDLLTPICNSRDPETLRLSNSLKLRISKTLKRRHKNREIFSPTYRKGKRYNIYNNIGNLLYESLTSEEIVCLTNISNRSVLNNAIRNNRFIINTEFLCIPINLGIEHYIKSIYLHSGKYITLFKIDSKTFSITKCTTSMKNRVVKKVLENDLLYFSKKNKCYYTFFGLLNKVPSSLEID